MAREKTEMRIKKIARKTGKRSFLANLAWMMMLRMEIMEVVKIVGIYPPSSRLAALFLLSRINLSNSL